jgi:hypothetical protein
MSRPSEQRSSYARLWLMGTKRKNPHAVALGRRGGKRGGKKGGKARWEGISPEERSEIARKAALARWRRAK